MRSERSAEGAQWNSSKSFYLFFFIYLFSVCMQLSPCETQEYFQMKPFGSELPSGLLDLCCLV